MKIKYLVFSILLLLTFTGCSTNELNSPDKQQATLTSDLQEEDEFADFEDEYKEEIKSQNPFEQYNIVMTNFNDGFYEYVYDPIVQGYRKIVPNTKGSLINNTFQNLMFPIRFVNNILQLKFANAAEETQRFLINSTLGVVGLFDIAKDEYGLKAHNEDFGQTLGYWGVGSGYHIVLPLFGPSNIRDTFSMYPDSIANPIAYSEKTPYNLTNNPAQSLTITTYQRINAGSLQVGEYEELKKEAIKLYPFLRDVYEQHRQQQIEE